MVLFHADITSWTDWGHVFQDKEAFAPLCMAILEKEGLPKLPLSSLTPGTNAVFRSGGAVLKVFYPPECGTDSLYDWETEKRVLEFAAQEGVPAPRLLAAGEIQDRYLFRYLIIEFCEGKEAGELLTLYEPIHGSAPDIAGQNLANPIGTILSAAMMLRYSFDMAAEADDIEKAVNAVLNEGYRTGDIFSEGTKKVSCSEMGDLITAHI